MAENSLTDYLGLPEVFELRINLSDYPEAPAAELDEVWLVVVEPAEQWGPPPGLEAAVLRALAGSDDARPAVVFDYKRSAYEWGASYSTEFIVITIATGMVSAAAWDGVKAACRTAYRSLSRDTGAQRLIDDRPTTDDIAERARWYVEAKFELSEADLVLKATEERSQTSWRVEFEGLNGTKYIADYELSDGLLFVKMRQEFA